MRELIMMLTLAFGIIGSIAYLGIQSDHKFIVKLQAEADKCLATPGETKYSCAAYINSLQAKRSADNAETFAIISNVNSAVAISSKR